MKILITGANGYIGKTLHNRLKKKYDVTTITHKDVDLTSLDDVVVFFKEKIFDVVIHCAAVGCSPLKEDNIDILNTNLCMYYNLLLCKDKFQRLIHFGSGAEDIVPESPYGLSKKLIAKSINEIDGFYNIKIFGVFDENELNGRFIKANLMRYINKESMLIYENKIMDFFYMEDLVSVVEFYLNNSNNNLEKKISCSYLKKYSLVDIANIINGLDKHKVNINIDFDLGVDYFSTIETPYNLNLIGLENGIKKTYNKLITT